MLRQSLTATLIVLIQVSIAIADDSEEGRCMILNTSDHPVVIGLYQPTDDGIKERLVKVASKTQMADIPVELATDAQFVIAYEASVDDATISRAKPVAIRGHTVLRYIRKRVDTKLPHVMIQYRGSSSIHGTRPGPFNTALYLPDSASEAKRVLRDANHTSRLIETPLAQQNYTDKTDP